MALAIDKNGNIIDKHLLMDEASIRKTMSTGNKENQKKVLQKALKVKIVRVSA